MDDYTEKNLFPTVKVGFLSVWASFVLSAFFPLFQSMQVNRQSTRMPLGLNDCLNVLYVKGAV